jgi:hypothetical protein
MGGEGLAVQDPTLMIAAKGFCSQCSPTSFWRSAGSGPQNLLQTRVESPPCLTGDAVDQDTEWRAARQLARHGHRSITEELDGNTPEWYPGRADYAVTLDNWHRFADRTPLATFVNSRVVGGGGMPCRSPSCSASFGADWHGR